MSEALDDFQFPEIVAFNAGDKFLIPRLQELAARYLTQPFAEKFSALVFERLPRDSRYTHRIAMLRDTKTERRLLAEHLGSTTYRVLIQYVEPMWFDIFFRAVYPSTEAGFAMPQLDSKIKPGGGSVEDKKSDGNASEKIVDAFGYLNRRIDLTDVDQYRYFRSKPFTELEPEEQLKYVLQDFVHSSNSDLHLQVNKEYGRISYRNNGDLEEKFTNIPHKQYRALAFALCVAGKGDPQDMDRQAVDSVINVRAFSDNEPTDMSLRFNSQKSDYGASITVRLQKDPIRDINRIGYSADYQIPLILNALAQPHGIIPVSGATGSGKTNTLESFFNVLETPPKCRKKIIEIASPIEIESLYRTQISVKKVGFTARAALESALRADPDVICVGEARDREYLELALEGALTGHLVMMTYHGSNIEKTLSRFLTMNMERTQIAESLNTMVSQTLVKTICQHCREVDTRMSARLDYQVFYGTGCASCFYSGFSGRTAIAEVLQMNDNLKDLIEGGLSPSKIVGRAIDQHDFVQMHDHAKEKIQNGTITYLQAALALGRRRQQQQSSSERTPTDRYSAERNTENEEAADLPYDVTVMPLNDTDHSEGANNYETNN